MKTNLFYKNLYKLNNQHIAEMALNSFLERSKLIKGFILLNIFIF
ncbi:hypothetical protein AsAng_0020220 [Aureispira anguillae]|uniref:Uncharacterized protein n=1 Tax=Aureispira anguillae TaxID=2864201 RepID=A0A915YE05_9BACT|nr:hypothetical protein AsAng_0020220 [Aureispira anguillae]